MTRLFTLTALSLVVIALSTATSSAAPSKLGSVHGFSAKMAAAPMIKHDMKDALAMGPNKGGGNKSFFKGNCYPKSCNFKSNWCGTNFCYPKSSCYWGSYSTCYPSCYPICYPYCDPYLYPVCYPYTTPICPPKFGCWPY